MILVGPAGTFEDELTAAQAYDKRARQSGETLLNFPDEHSVSSELVEVNQALPSVNPMQNNTPLAAPQCFAQLTTMFPSTVTMFAPVLQKQPERALEQDVKTDGVSVSLLVSREWLQTWLAMKCMTQLELADRIGMNQSDLSLFVNQKVTLWKAKKISAAVLAYITRSQSGEHAPSTSYCPSVDGLYTYRCSSDEEDTSRCEDIQEDEQVKDDGKRVRAVKRPGHLALYEVYESGMEEDYVTYGRSVDTFSKKQKRESVVSPDLSDGSSEWERYDRARASQVRALIDKLGITQGHASTEAGVPQSWLSVWLRGQNSVSRSTIHQEAMMLWHSKSSKSHSSLVLSVGKAVMAQYVDGHYYPATIVAFHGKVIQVAWDDGDESGCIVGASQIRKRTASSLSISAPVSTLSASATQSQAPGLEDTEMMLSKRETGICKHQSALPSA